MNINNSLVQFLLFLSDFWLLWMKYCTQNVLERVCSLRSESAVWEIQIHVSYCDRVWMCKLHEFCLSGEREIDFQCCDVRFVFIENMNFKKDYELMQA